MHNNHTRNLGQVPVDGVAVHGAAHVSNQHITGEALPILAEEGTELLAGALATDSWLILRATRVARESALARIAELTETAKVRLRFLPPLYAALSALPSPTPISFFEFRLQITSLEVLLQIPSSA